MRSNPKGSADAAATLHPSSSDQAGAERQVPETSSDSLAEAAPTWREEGAVALDAQARLMRCISEFDSSHQAEQTQVDRLALRLQRAAAQSQKVDAERQRLKEEINGVITAIDRTLNLLHPASRSEPGWSGAGGAAEALADFDPTTILQQVIERAGRRIGSLCSEIRELYVSQHMAAAQVSHLQSQVNALSEQKRSLEDQAAVLSREIVELRQQTGHDGRRMATVVAQAGRWVREHDTPLDLFGARLPDYAAYAARVGHDPRRLFAFLLLADMSERDDVPDDWKQHATEIAEIFDPLFYIGKYGDVREAGINPLLHYVECGWHEARRPHLFFDVEFYLHQVGNLDGDPLRHYAMVGVFDGRKPHPLLDGGYYWQSNPDVAADRRNPIFHYDLWGGRERRRPSPMFDTEYFLEKYDSPLPCDNPLREYLQQEETDWAVDPHPLFSHAYFSRQAGIAQFSEAPLVTYLKFPALWESTRVHPLFDPAYVRIKAAALGSPVPDDLSPFEHFCRTAATHDLDPHLLFDSRLYRYQVETELNRPLSDAPVVDYLKRGFRDKSLLPTKLFDPQTYRARNQVETALPDLVHYCLEGDHEGFWCHPMFCAEVYNRVRSDGEAITALEHYLGAPAETAAPTHPHLQRPLSGRPGVFIDQVVNATTDIDPVFYRAANPDLNALSDDQLVGHFEAHGREEGRFGSARQVVQKLRLRIRDIPLGFFAEDYVRFNPDLAILGDDFNSLFRHYLEIGRGENRSFGHWQFYLNTAELPATRGPSAPVTVNRDLALVDVAILMHIGYDDLWPELAGFAQNFDVVTKDVFINVVDEVWSPRFHSEIRALCPGAFVLLSNNTGRDIGGFVRLLDNVDFAKYELFALMHSKKSPHIAPEKGAHWRRELLSAFAGSPETVAECVALFRNDASVGLIGCANYRATDLGQNEAHWRALLDRFGIDQAHREPEYLSGTMFLIRSNILQRFYEVLKDIQFEYGSGKDVEYHRDGQIAHGVERVIGNLVQQMGYRIEWR